MDVVLAAFATFSGMEYPTIIFTNRDRQTPEPRARPPVLVRHRRATMSSPSRGWTNRSPRGRSSCRSAHGIAAETSRPSTADRHHERHGVLGHAHQPVRHGLRRRGLHAREPGESVRHPRDSSTSWSATRTITGWAWLARRLQGGDRGCGCRAPSRAGHGRLLGHLARWPDRVAWAVARTTRMGGHEHRRIEGGPP